MKTKIIITLIVLLISPFIVSGLIFAQGSEGAVNIIYPVDELGGCANQVACKEYCDNPENADACLAFAQKNGLMSKKEVKIAEQFLSGSLNGPGGCNNKETCETYCEDLNHIDECIAFAEENNFLPEKDLDEAKKVQVAIKNGITPPACGSKKACDTYCEDSNHMEECINFAMQAGFMQGKELEEAQKMLEALKRGVKPLPCKGKEACDEFCANPDNMEACINFASEAGFMSEEEKANSQKMLQALKKGVKPPACKGKEECDVYCSSEEHFEECVNFSIAAGMMSEEDATMARKTGGKGPGGCKGKEECEAFCNDPANQETCFTFGRDNGMISEEDLKKMEEGKQQTMDTINQADSETIKCLNDVLGSETVEKMKNGTAMLNREIGDKMSVCFMQNNGEMQPGSEGVQGAPCKSPEECQAFCESNQDRCENGMPKFNSRKEGNGPENFQSEPGQANPGGNMMPPQTGPGGCQSPEECEAFCQANPQTCGAPSGSTKQTPQGNQIMPPEGQIPQNQPCQGENCQNGPMPGQKPQQMQSRQEIQPSQQIPPGQNQGQSPPFSEELGGGDRMAPPGPQEVPLAPPINQTPPAEQQPTSLINPNYLVGSLINVLLSLILPR